MHRAEAAETCFAAQAHVSFGTFPLLVSLIGVCTVASVYSETAAMRGSSYSPDVVYMQDDEKRRKQATVSGLPPSPTKMVRVSCLKGCSKRIMHSHFSNSCDCVIGILLQYCIVPRHGFVIISTKPVPD